MKEKIKRLFASIAAILMAIGLVGANAVPVMAAGETDGSITITNTVKDEVYKVYKVFDATTNNANGTNGATGKNISYTYTSTATVGTTDAFLTALQGDTSPFTLADIGSNTYTVTLKERKEASDVVAFLNANVSNLGTPVNGADGTTSTGSDITVNNLSYGYYYITTTTGSAVSIDSAAKSVSVAEKNSVPSIDKKQKLTADGEYADTDLNAKIGSTVYYQITFTAGKTNDKDVYITDTLSNGLSLNYSGSGTGITLNDWSIKKYTNGTGEGADVDQNSFTISDVTLQGFKVHLKPDFVKTLNGPADGANADTVVITYSANINSNAVTGTDANTNEAKLEYSHQTTTDTTKVYTYDFDLVKTDSSNVVLPGAEFSLYAGTAGEGDSVTKSGEAIQFVKINATDSTPETYRVATPAEKSDNSVTKVTTIKAGFVRVSGLDNGTYALEETKAPDGYVKLTAPVKVTVNGANNRATVTTSGETQTWTSGGIHVTNNAGSVLPSTGGIGTTIFYVAGGILIIGAAVLLIARRKRNA